MTNTNKSQPQSKTSEVYGEESDAVHKRLRELMFLHETSQVLTATLDLDSVLRSLLSQVRDYFQVDAASVALLDEKTGELVFRVAVGKAAKDVMGLRLPLGQGIAGWVVQTGKPALVPAANSDERFYSGVDEDTDFHTQTMLAVPIEVEGRTIGVIEAINPAAGSFDEDAQRSLFSVTDLAAAAIRNADLYERALRAERRYESLFNGGSDPILVLNLEGEVVDLNQKAIEMLNLSRAQVIGAYLCHLFDISQEMCRTRIQQVRKGQSLSLEMRIQRNEGVRILEAHMARVGYDGQGAIQWIGHDISEQVELERMRDDLTHMVIHDLRNPLGSIMNSLQLIRVAFVELDQTLPVLKLLDIACRSGEKLHRLIDSLLDLRRLEAGETKLNETSLSPAQLIQEAVEQIEPLALNRGQSIAVKVDPDLPRVFVDGDLLRRVLTNLLDNAVKFSMGKGDIRVSAKWMEEDVLFTVSDSGPGISPEYHQHIFDRFSRLEKADGIKGTGLGLAFCKLAVEAHGGRIWVESDLGQDSHFKFTLPLEAGGAE